MDDGAFSRELCGCYTFLVKLARLRYHLPKADAEDAAQEALMRAWANRAGYREEFKFRGWLTVIMFNHILSMKRRSGRVIYTDEFHDCPAPDNPENTLFLKQVTKAMDGLSVEHQDAIFLNIQGDGQATAAEKAGVAVGTMKSRLWRARENLRRAVA